MTAGVPAPTAYTTDVPYMGAAQGLTRDRPLRIWTQGRSISFWGKTGSLPRALRMKSSTSMLGTLSQASPPPVSDMGDEPTTLEEPILLYMGDYST